MHTQQCLNEEICKLQALDREVLSTNIKSPDEIEIIYYVTDSGSTRKRRLVRDGYFSAASWRCFTLYDEPI